MSEAKGDAGPREPASRDNRMLLEVHGAFRPVVGSRSDGLDEDLYSVFLARSSALGWNPLVGSERGDSLWEMNDAGPGPPAPRGVDVAWFQVGAVQRETVGISLPVCRVVLPLLSCAGQVLDRWAEWELIGIRLRLPVVSGDVVRAKEFGTLAVGLNWFGWAAPSARTPVLVTLDVDVDSVLLLDLLRGWAVAPFVVRDVREVPVTPTEPVAVSPCDPTGRRTSEQPSLVRVEINVDLPEWTLDAVGWFLALAALVVVPSDDTGRLTLAVVRSTEPR